jgi:hypothetical protein
MINNKLFTSLTLMGLFVFSSCNLDLTPEDTLSPKTYFKNGPQLELWANHFYSLLPDADDLAKQNADDNISSELGETLMGQRSAASEDGWNWDRLRDINYYLQHSNQCSDENARKHYDGVAYFFRAYFYFEKVKRYGDVPWYDQVLNSNEDKLLAKPRQDRELIMDSVMKDLDRAITMLPVKKDPVHVTKWTALAFKSRAALYEGTFRKYRGMNNYEKYLKQAADAGEEFINNSGYKLYTKGAEPYRTLFNSIDAVSDEVILTKKYSNTSNVRHSIPFNIIIYRQGFTKRFMNHYLMSDGSRFDEQPGWQTMGYVAETKHRDPRLSQTVLCPGYVQVDTSKETVNDLSALTGYRPIKFVNASPYDGSLKAITDYPLFRAAEVYLNFAEAKAELGTLSQIDLDKSINKIRDRVGMPHLNMLAANTTPDNLLLQYYPNVTKNTNTGVILEIRRERTVELALEGFRLWDIFRWKEGQQLTKEFDGCYFPGPGEYDLNEDGIADILLYTTNKGNFKGASFKIGKDIILTNNTSGNIHALSNITISWDENRDYLWPIPASERVLTSGALTQNPGWTDTTNFN